MDTPSELITMLKSVFGLVKSMGYELRVEGEDLDLHDSDGTYIGTVGYIEVD